MAYTPEQWDEWRRLYVTGDDSVTLEALASRKKAPAFNTLKKRSAAESWSKQRETFRIQKGTIVASDPAVIQAAEQVSKLVDVAEMITRQSAISKGFQMLAAKWLKQARTEELKGSEAIAMFRDSAKLEQLLAGLATEHCDVTSGGQPLIPRQIRRIVIEADGSSESYG